MPRKSTGDTFALASSAVDSTTMNIATGLITHEKPEGFFSERLDGSKIHTKMSAVVMWKDTVRRYLMNPNANLPVNDQLLQRMTS